MLPKSIAQRLKTELARPDTEEDQHVLIADNYSEVSILFADIVHFSDWSANIDADRIVKLLNIIVSSWDAIAITFGVEKIKVFVFPAAK